MLVYPFFLVTFSDWPVDLRDLPRRCRRLGTQSKRHDEEKWRNMMINQWILGYPKSNRNLKRKSVLPFQHILGRKSSTPATGIRSNAAIGHGHVIPVTGWSSHWSLENCHGPGSSLGQHPCLHSKIAGLVVDAHPSQRLCNSWSIPGLRIPNVSENVVTPKSHDVSSISSIKIVVGWWLPLFLDTPKHHIVGELKFTSRLHPIKCPKLPGWSPFHSNTATWKWCFFVQWWPVGERPLGRGSWVFTRRCCKKMVDYPMKNVERQAISHVGMTTSYLAISRILGVYLVYFLAKKAGFWPPFGPHFLTPKFAKDLLWHWLLWRPPPDHGVPRRSSAWSPTSRGVSFIKWFDLNGWTNVPGMNEPLSIDNY